MRLVIAGGGTGGHVMPGLALAERASAAGDAVLFVGTDRGMETRLVPEAGHELVALGSRPLVGRSPMERVTGVLALVGSTWQALRVLRRFRADLVVSVGGYAAAPVCLAAATRRVPLAVVEANARPGLANRLVARLAGRIFVEYEEGGRRLVPDEGEIPIQVSGLPLRRELVSRFEAIAAPRAPESPYRIFVFGGSQGARQINEALISALPELEPGRYEFVHQTGEADRSRVEAAYAEAGVAATVVAFESDMASRYAWADLVVCRAGALTLAELALAGRPALLVPLLHTGGGEQQENARARESEGAAIVFEPGEAPGAALAAAIDRAFEEPEALARMAAAARSAARPRAAEQILGACRSLAAGLAGKRP